MSNECRGAADRRRWTTDGVLHRNWWIVAVALFGAGDLALTLFGLVSARAVEAHPIAGRLVATYGVWVLVPVKIAVVGAFYGFYRATPREFRIGVPLGLSLLGAVVAGWNLYVLSGAPGAA
jgi:Mn2+/Fe2+ NRAMP family transporter